MLAGILDKPTRRVNSVVVIKVTMQGPKCACKYFEAIVLAKALAGHTYDTKPMTLELTLSAFSVHSVDTVGREIDSPICLRFPILGSTRDNKPLSPDN